MGTENRSLKLTMKPAQKQLVDALITAGVVTSPVTRAAIAEANQACGKSASVPSWILHDQSRRAGRGLFHVPEVAGGGHETPAPAAAPVVQPAAPVESPVQTAPPPAAAPSATLALTGGESATLVPNRMRTYVPFGHFDDMERIVMSGLFYPCFVTGLSGNGKTTMVEQICAKHNREFYRVNITCQTDEDDLLGGFRLINGETVWCDGPVVAAMKNGGVLLLDEIDLASHAIMCLQPVLEGKGVFLKKIGQWVQPAAGFQIFATANTKGKGDESGKFAATNVLNEAFLDRFPVCVEQEYPEMSTEKKIVTAVMKSLGLGEKEDKDFGKHLCKWSNEIRTLYFADGVDEIVTTRRVVNIVTAYSMFRDRRKAIQMGVTRFDAATQESFISLYEKIDAAAQVAPEATGEVARYDLTSTFDEKDEVKQAIRMLGGNTRERFDPVKKCWWITQAEKDTAAFERWNPTPVYETATESEEAPW